MVIFAQSAPASADTQLQLGQTYGLPRIVISSGGPYPCQDTSIQHFYDKIVVPPNYVHQPLQLVFTNGSLSSPGYRWVRVLLTSGQLDQNVSGSDQSFGKLLVDEHSFLNNSQAYVDMSGQLHAGTNQIHVEGAGLAGSVFSWELRSVGPPTLSKFNPSFTVDGGVLTLAGYGFSLRPEENLIRIGPVVFPAERTTPESISFHVPNSIPAGGPYPLAVSVRGYPSNTIKISVVPNAEVSSINPTIVMPGQGLNISGKNFSNNPTENIVYFGSTPARLVNCSESSMTVVVPRISPGRGQITVFVRGAQASGNPTVQVTMPR